MIRRLFPVSLVAALLLSGGAEAALRVTFVAPERFRDANRAGGVLPAAAALRDLAAHLQRLGRRLPAGQDLDIEILDVDFAGVSAEHRPEAHATRFFGLATWPSVRLRYRLREPGRPVRQNEELVADREYLSHPTVSFAADPLRYEKDMLSDWFEARFVLGREPRP